MKAYTSDGALKIADRIVPGPKVSYDKATALAAGGSATIDSDQVSSGKTASLLGIVVSSSVGFKALAYSVSNGVPSTEPIGGGHIISGRLSLDLPARNLVRVAQDVAAGLDGFRVVVTNLDISLPADVDVWFYYSEG